MVNLERDEPAYQGRSYRWTRRDGWALALLLLLTALVGWNRVSFDSWLGRFDVATFFLPWYSFLGERLRQGDVPGWNPHLFSGTPFAGDPESGWMYLPAMVWFASLPVLAAMKAMVVSQLVIASASTYCYGRVLQMGRVGALVAAVAFSFGPFLHWNTYCCLVFAEFATWIPLALLGIEIALRARSWIRGLAACAVTGIGVSQMLAGWAGEGWFYAVLLVGAYAMVRSVSPALLAHRSVAGRLVAGMTTAGLGIGSGLALGAAGVLPRLSVNSQTHLAGGDYAQMGAGGILNPPWTLDQLGIRLLGSGYEQRSASLGGAVIVLALLAPFIARVDFPALFFAILTLIAWTLTQETTLLHEVFYLIPRYQALHEHDPWRTMALAGIGPAMLSGAAVDRLGCWESRRWTAPLMCLPLLLIGVVALLLRRSDLSVGSTPLLAATGATLLIGLVALRPASGWPRSSPRFLDRLAPLLLLALVFIQPVGLELSGAWLGWPRDDSWRDKWHASPATEAALQTEVSDRASGGSGAFLQQLSGGSEPFRYVGYGGIGYPGDRSAAGSYMGRRFDPNVQALLVNGRPIFLGLYDIQGYDPLQLARYADFINALNGRSLDYHVAYLLPSGVNSTMLDLLDVQYVVVDRRLPAGRDDLVALVAGRQEVYRDDTVVIYDRVIDLPHAWIVHDIRAVTREEALAGVASGQIDPYRTALVEGPVPPSGAAAMAGAESATVLTYEPDRARVAVSAQTPGLMVISENYADGWNASIDGEDVDVLATDAALRGVPVPAGEHVVEFHYEPRSLQLGLVVSLAATVAVAAVFAAVGWSWRDRRRRLAR